MYSPFLTFWRSMFYGDKVGVNRWEFSYIQWDFNTLPVTDEMAICLVTLSEPELKCEPTTSQPVSLLGTGLLPSDNPSPGSLPTPATISNTCFHCSRSWPVETVGMPTTCLVLRTLKRSSRVRVQQLWQKKPRLASPYGLHSWCAGHWMPALLWLLVDPHCELPICLKNEESSVQHVPCSLGWACEPLLSLHPPSVPLQFPSTAECLLSPRLCAPS